MTLCSLDLFVIIILTVFDFLIQTQAFCWYLIKFAHHLPSKILTRSFQAVCKLVNAMYAEFEYCMTILVHRTVLFKFGNVRLPSMETSCIC